METVAGMNTTTTSSSSTTTPDWTISTFSLSEWRKTRDSTQLLELCHGVGFFYVTDHGIPNEFFDKHFQLVRDFFRLPDSSKALIEKRKSRHFRGWERVGAELTNNRVDHREQVDLSEEHEPYAIDIEPHYLRLDGPNQWLPDEVLPHFKEGMRDFLGRLRSVASELLSAIAEGFGLPSDFFNDIFGTRPLNYMKLIHYPPTPEGEAGVNPHKDAGFISLLVQDGMAASGLQALAPDGRWLEVNPPQGAIAVNIGEILQAMSGNYLIACVHRVVAKQQRFSSAYFHGPDLRTAIVPIDIPQRLRDAVAASPRHSAAKFMSTRQELLEGKDTIGSSSAQTYGEQIWNYLVRSYPDSVRYHYPDYIE